MPIFCQRIPFRNTPALFLILFVLSFSVIEQLWLYQKWLKLWTCTSLCIFETFSENYKLVQNLVQNSAKYCIYELDHTSMVRHLHKLKILTQLKRFSKIASLAFTDGTDNVKSSNVIYIFSFNFICKCNLYLQFLLNLKTNNLLLDEQS